MCTTWYKAVTLLRARLSCRERPNDRFSLRSPNKRGTRCGLDLRRASEVRSVPLSKPAVGVAPSLDSPVLSDRRVLGRVNWMGSCGIRDAFDATYESHADLSANKKSPSRSTSP